MLHVIIFNRLVGQNFNTIEYLKFNGPILRKRHGPSGTSVDFAHLPRKLLQKVRKPEGTGHVFMMCLHCVYIV